MSGIETNEGFSRLQLRASNPQPNGVVVFDCDGTLTPRHGSWETVHNVLGTRDHQKEYEEKYRNGKITFGEWSRITAEHWRGNSIDAINRALDDIEPVAGLQETIDQIHDYGFRTGIVSAGIDNYVERITERANFDFALSNCLATEGGRLTGELTMNVTESSKQKCYRKIARSYDVPVSRIAAIGDAKCDLETPSPSSLRIAFNPKDEDVVEATDIVVRERDLRNILPILTNWINDW